MYADHLICHASLSLCVCVCARVCMCVCIPKVLSRIKEWFDVQWVKDTTCVRSKTITYMATFELVC